MAQIFATTSGKGGVGKSTVAVGLGHAFADLGNKVLLVDMDEGLRCLDLLLGVDDSAVLDLTDAINSGDIEGSAYSCRSENLKLLPAPADIGSLDHGAFKEFAKKAYLAYDVVIFDFPAGLDFSLYSLLPSGTQFLAVATPDPVSVRGAAAVSRKLEEKKLKSRLIINRFNLKEMSKRRLKNIDGIIDTASIRLLGIVPETDDLNGLSVTHKLKKRGRARKAFLRIAHRLSDNPIPLHKLKKI